jgi:dynein heavy chain
MGGQKILFPSAFSMVTTLYDLVTVRDWVLEGLPNDPISIENAIIAKKGIRYPLMIDPQSQANKFFKRNLKSMGLSIVNFE